MKIHFPDGSMDGGVGAEKAIIRSKSTKDPVLTIERDNVLLVKTNEIERLCSQNQCEINIHKQMSREKKLNLKFHYVLQNRKCGRLMIKMPMETRNVMMIIDEDDQEDDGWGS